MTTWTIHQGNALDVLRAMPDESVQMCVTSPPYWSLRDYGCEGQLGLEDTPEAFVAALADVFDEVHRVLSDDGVLWLNLGDSYLSAKCDYMPPQTISGDKVRDYVTKDSGIGYPPNRRAIRGLKQKDLVGIPWMVAFELRRRGWWLRQDIIWSKPNPMPESVTDRCTKSHEYIFLLSKSKSYYFDHIAIQEEANYDGRKDIMFKGAAKYDLPLVPGSNTQGFHSRGRERWQTKSTFGNRDGHLDGLHSGKEWTPQTKGRDRTVGNRNGEGQSTLDHKNLQHDGQTPHSMHLSRAEGKEWEMKRKYDGTEYGGAGTGFTDHSGYSNLDNPFVRNKRSVWTVTTKPLSDAHFATFPEKLIEPCILAGSKAGDTVLDPFNGAGTSGLVSLKHGRNYVGIELNPDYIKIAEKRLAEVQVKLF